MADSSPRDPAGGLAPSLRAVDRGLDLLFATDVTKDVLEATDFDRLRGDAPIDEAVDVRNLAAAIGQSVGRVAVRGVARTVVGGVVAGVFGSALGGRVDARLLRSAVERTRRT